MKNKWLIVIRNILIVVALVSFFGLITLNIKEYVLNSKQTETKLHYQKTIPGEDMNFIVSILKSHNIDYSIISFMGAPAIKINIAKLNSNSWYAIRSLELQFPDICHFYIIQQGGYLSENEAKL